MDVKQNSELLMTAQKIEDQTSIDVKNKSTTNAEIIQVEDNEVTQQKSINIMPFFMSNHVLKKL